MDLHATPKLEQCTTPTGLVNLFIPIDSDDASFLSFSLPCSQSTGQEHNSGHCGMDRSVELLHFISHLNYMDDMHLHRSYVKYILTRIANYEIEIGDISVVHVRKGCFLFEISLLKL